MELTTGSTVYVQFAETELRESIMEPPAVMDVRDSLDVASGRVMFTPAGLVDSVLLTKTNGTNADFAV